MILDMLRVRDFDVQYACTRALLHLIRHNGEVGWSACYSRHLLHAFVGESIASFRLFFSRRSHSKDIFF